MSTVLGGVKSPPGGISAERERRGAAFVRARVHLAFPDLDEMERRRIIQDLYPATGGRPNSKSRALQGYAARLFSTCGMSRAELHRAFLQIGWAQLDERDWWTQTRDAAEALQAALIERGGRPGNLHAAARRRPSDQRIRFEGYAVIAEEQRTSEPDIVITTNLRAVKKRTHPALEELRGERWAVDRAVRQLEALAEPKWVAHLFAEMPACRAVAVEAAAARLWELGTTRRLGRHGS